MRVERLAGKVMLLWGARRAFLAIAAGAIGVLALPPFGFFAALFVSFTLLVWLLDGAASHPESGWLGRLRPAFVTGWLFGFGYFVAGLWWLGNALMIEAEEFAWALPFAILGLPAVLAIFYGLATAFARLFWSDGMGRIAALAAGFGLAEWLRSFVATGFPWNAIGYGAKPFPMMMQSAHAIGLFGVTTLSVFVFAAPALIGTRRGMVPGLLIAVALFAAHLGYGAYRLTLSATVPDDTPVTIRLVQPRIDQAQKLDDAERSAIFEEHLALSRSAAEEGGERPDIVVWPETSVPFILTQNQDALARIAEVLEDGQILVAGAVRAEEMGAGIPPRYYNSVYVIDDKGQIIGASDKVHLVPFGEYVPFEDILRNWGIDNVVNMPGGFSPASARQMLTLPDGLKLWPLICYEAIFPQLTGQAAEGADAILNLTNDAWFGNSPGPYQHFHQARVRAVESGLPLIRGANSGISTVVDSYGRVVAGLDFDKRGVLNATIARKPELFWNEHSRMRNFWLIIAGIIIVAAGARIGFISGKN